MIEILYCFLSLLIVIQLALVSWNQSKMKREIEIMKAHLYDNPRVAIVKVKKSKGSFKRTEEQRKAASESKKAYWAKKRAAAEMPTTAIGTNI